MGFWTDQSSLPHCLSTHLSLQDLVKRLSLSPPEAKAAGTTYNVAGINALVMYIGCTAKPGTSPMDKATGGALVPGPAMVRACQI